MRFILIPRRDRILDDGVHQQHVITNVSSVHVTDDKAAIVYDMEEGVQYQVEISNGHRFDVEPMAFIGDEQEVLAHALGKIGFRNIASSVQERLPAYFKREASNDRQNA